MKKLLYICCENIVNNTKQYELNRKIPNELRDLLNYYYLCKHSNINDVIDDVCFFIESGYTELVELFLVIGVINDYLIRPFRFAVYHENIEIIKLLIKYNTDVIYYTYDTPMYMAIINNNIKVVELLIEYYPERLSINKFLYWARRSGYTEIINFLESKLN